ncbi:hypothetical protein QQF64_007728 [Cirrhinus molitorella]|uniref:Helicase ATP-binding domain-containing protein n=1 Tax=Cirrhinus molitorella TaxID=172907 RepID=A0ABR3MEH4_9TELE
MVAFFFTTALDQGKRKVLKSKCGALTWLRDLWRSRLNRGCLDFWMDQEKKCDSVEGGEQQQPSIRADCSRDDQVMFLTGFQSGVLVVQDEELKRKKREERLEMIRHNGQLRYAMKRKVGEEDEAVKLLQAQQRGADLEFSLRFFPRLCDEDDDEDLEEDHVTKIYYCSRTHAQLLSLWHEVQKSPYGASCVPHLLTWAPDSKKLEKASDSETKRRRGVPKATCPFSGFENLMAMRDEVLVKNAAHASTRKASGIKLKDQIVIIDEAHNLTDTISAIHSTEISGGQLCRAHSQLSQYCERYRGALCVHYGGKVGQNPNTQSCQPEASLQTINDFLFKAQVDNINLFKVQKYFEKSMISQKLCGFVEKYEGSGVNTHSSSKNKENRRTEGLGRFLQTLQNKPK